MNILKGERGMSLIEVLIVMVISGILASIAVPSFTQWIATFSVDEESRRVMMDLMEAKGKAISDGCNVVVTFNTPANGYTILEDLNNNGIQDAGEPSWPHTLQNKVVFNINAGLNDVFGNALGSATANFGGTSILTFNSQGQASATGSVYLIPSTDVGVKNTRMKAVSVLLATGSVKLWTYSAGANPPWK